MAKKLSEFLTALIKKAGGNVDDEKLRTALATIDANMELQDEIITAIDHGLISIENAKNNHPEIMKHYKAQVYNGLDSELERFMEDEKFGDDIVAEIKGEKSSTKRAILISKKIQELERAKAGQGKAETKTLNDQIVALNAELRREKDSIAGVRTEYEKKLRDKDKGYAMRNLLSGYTTIHDKMDADTKNIIINAIIDKNLKALGYQFDLDENGNLVIAQKDGSTAFAEDHTPLTPKRFLDGMMASENLLVVSDSNQNNNRNNTNNTNNGGNNFNRNNFNNGGNNFNRNNNNTNQNQNNQNNGNNGGGKTNTVLKELLNQAQADYNSGGTKLF